MTYTTKQIAELTDSQLIGDTNAIISRIAFDSRNLYSSSETAFIAINTPNNSGEKYIASAIEKGVKVIISENYNSDFKDISWVIVEDCIQFLQTLAKRHFTDSSLKNSIGITGSNGKTIVKEWLYQCLWNEIPVVKSPKSFNSQIGLPISLLEINEKHQLGIFEVGISKPQEMEILEQIFSPRIGILTHIGTAHSFNFRNEEELIDEKIKLFQKSDVIIFNGDNDLVFSKIKKTYSTKKLISFGLKHHNDVHIFSDYKNPNELIKIKYKNETLELPVQQRDEATLSNALAVITCLKELGFSNEKIIDKINNLRAVEMRLESVNGVKNNLIINDSFNLDLDSLTIAYQFINQYQKPKKSLILTDI
ncbi:MAG: Mur ligase family protein, partial [Bergeyella zoohelcum]|nr:Mur ligase family protein [Bergeyella zoohelcum]